MISENIIGKSIIIRIADLDDAEYSFNIRQNKEKTKFMPSMAGDYNTQRNWIKIQRESKDCYFFIVEDLLGYKIGVLSIYNIMNDKAETGRVILNGNPIQNMESLIMLYDFAFNTLKLNTIKTEIFENNYSACGVTVRMGGVVVNKKYDSDMKMNLLEYQVHIDDFNKKRLQLFSLIERFSNR